MDEITLGLIIILYGLVYSTLAAIFSANKGKYSLDFYQFLPNTRIVGFLVFVLSGQLLGAILILLSSYYKDEKDTPELDGLLLTLGGLCLLLSSTDNLFADMLIIEMISLILYTLVPLNRDIGGVIAGSNYFIYGSFMALWGYAGLLLIYKSVGSLDKVLMADLILENNLAIFGFMLFLSYILFKLAAFPFQSWAPVVYGKMPQGSLFIFAVITKFTFGIFLLDLMDDISLVIIHSSLINKFFYISVVGSMLYGVWGSLNTTKINTLLAYSSIIHIGYFLLPLTTLSRGSNIELSLESSAFYLGVYTLSTSLFLLCLLSTSTKFVYLTDLKSNFPFYTYCGLIVSAMSIAGLPPTLGFLAKWEVWSHLYYSFDSAPFFNMTLYLIIFSFIINILSVWFYIKLILLPTVEWKKLFSEQNESQICSVIYIITVFLIVAPFVIM